MNFYNIYKSVFICLILAFHSCNNDLESEVYSNIVSENFYQNDTQIAAAASVAYTPLYNAYWQTHALQGTTTDQTTVPIRVNNGWNNGGQWPRLMKHDFIPNEPFLNIVWNRYFGGVAACNRIIEIFQEYLEPDSPQISELRSLRAYYYLKLVDLFGYVPVQTSFSEASSSPEQSTPSETFAFIEKELLESIPNLSEEKNTTTYAKVNKWVAYSILTDLYINAERFNAGSHYTEAAEAANEIINSGLYSLESGYFKNFRINNQDSNENIFVIPFDKNNATGLNIWSRALHQSARPTFNLAGLPYGGFSIQEDFYNSYSSEDKRRGMFITGQQYTIEAEPQWSDTEGFFYANPQEQFELIDCTEDYNRMLPEELEEEPIDCSVFISTDIDLSSARGIALYREGARYGKYEIELNSGTRNYSNDYVLYRYAHILLLRAEALYKSGGDTVEALQLVNMVRQRAGIESLSSLSEDLIYWELKKELATENHARPTTIRFGHWEDAWFLKPANPGEEYKRFYPIPTSQLQANPNLQQNPGY